MAISCLGWLWRDAVCFLDRSFGGFGAFAVAEFFVFFEQEGTELCVSGASSAARGLFGDEVVAGGGGGGFVETDLPLDW